MYVSNPIKSWLYHNIIRIKLLNSNRAGQRYFKNNLTFPNYKACSDSHIHPSVKQTILKMHMYLHTALWKVCGIEVR